MILEKYKPEEILVQEFIDGQEYTVGVLANQLDEILLISSRKVISKKGITTHAVTDRNVEINKLAKEINNAFLPKGPFNIQLFLTNDNELKVFEINPRFSTTSVMNYAAKINEIELYIENEFESKLPAILEPKDGLFLRRNIRNNFYE